jgi:ferredoxin
MPKASSIIELFERLQSTNLAIHQERCVAVRNRHSSCTKCADACTSGAMAVSDNQLIITADLCIGCGTCASVCPTAALEAENPTDNELLRGAVAIMREKQEHPIFICSQVHDANKGSYDKSGVIELTCLGRLEETELIALMAFGASSIEMTHADCSQCENKAGARTVTLIQQNLTTLLEAWNHPNTVVLSDALPSSVRFKQTEAGQVSSPTGLSRRDFFRQIRANAQNVAAETAASVVPIQPEQRDITTRITRVLRDGSLPHFIPSRRERLLNHLDVFGEPTADSITTRLWGYVAIDAERCNSCRMCATFCPTGALSNFDDADGTMGVEHYPADCVQCRLCEDTCSLDALSVSATVPTRDLAEGKILRFEMNPHAVVNVGTHPNVEMPARAMDSLYGGSVQIRVR